MSDLPHYAKGSRARFFDADGVDELVSATLELAAEIATLRERQYVTERVLARHGLDIAREIEAFKASDDDNKAMAADRERLLATVLRSFSSASQDEHADTQREDGHRPRAA